VIIRIISISCPRVPLLLIGRWRGQIPMSTSLRSRQDFEVAGSFELLKDHVVHLRRSRQGGWHRMGQEPPFLHLAGAEKPLGHARAWRPSRRSAACPTAAFGVPARADGDGVQEIMMTWCRSTALGCFQAQSGDGDRDGTRLIEGRVRLRSSAVSMPIHVRPFLGLSQQAE